MSKKIFGILVLALLIVAGAGVLGFLPGSNDLSPAEATPEDVQGDTFAGEVTDDVPEGVYSGEIVYDANCSPVGDGLTGCDAGVDTQELGTINFYYEHDMQQKPCLVPPQEVVLEVEAEEAVVQRQ